MADVLYSEDVAARLDKSVAAVRGLIRRGGIPAPFRIGRRCAWRREDFDAWLERQAREASEGRRQ
ncbi:MULTISPECIES: AlpA family transcriptional regulator [unclassified Thioalkalivibrio]|uniref:helix-turn-helix transcriptional regulator n=1 Tax=unclassified Thioalkalivibrio TaxID=2621013 RepID=UPI000368F462|nr:MULTISPECIES: helix-turn-helix domain-containing protein [unclassified Thioalkalivibrio]